jgi:membrane protein CcdC involved in cytochrome C biogenesis
VKRWTQEHVDQAARAFASSSKADAWFMFGAEMQRAIIDSIVMDAIRMADVAGSMIQLTAGEIVLFRVAVEVALAAGVKKHSRAMRVSYKVEK